MRYTVILIGEASGFSALVPAMPGCQSQGDTPEEALGNVRAAMEGWLATESEQGRGPLDDTRAVILQGVAQAFDLLDEMRDAGEVPADFREDIRIATVDVRRAVAA